MVSLNFSFGQSKLSKDREAILSMCGCFEIEFNFAETFNYSRKITINRQRFTSHMHELAIPIVNQRKISIQHLLIVGPESNQSVLNIGGKIGYTKTLTFIFMIRKIMKYITKNKDEVKGQWTRKYSG